VKSVLLLSGGLDSAVALAECHDDTIAVHFSYGQTAERQERQAAQALSAHYGVTLEEVSIPMFPRPGSKCPVHVGDKPENVPGRNMIFLAYTESLLPADEYVMGAHLGDLRNGCQCRTLKLVTAQWLLTGPPVIRVQMRTKADLVRLGNLLGAPMELTWSCYWGDPRPCGACASCEERAAAFAEAGVLDQERVSASG